jgi:8-oxo-dGTP pyrophosphatase MutT (NUDIX family)
MIAMGREDERRAPGRAAANRTVRQPSLSGAIRQYGVIPFRKDKSGRIEVLLITSRDTGRWVVPRGNPIPGLSAPESAVQEAFEEAGIRGEVEALPIGTYGYEKKRASGLTEQAVVELFPLRVRETLDEWPERSQRARSWFACEEAADSVAEAELAALIREIGNGHG